MTFEVTNADDIKLKITCELKLSEWVRIREELQGKSNSSMWFKNDIQDVIDQAKKHFYPNT